MMPVTSTFEAFHMASDAATQAVMSDILEPPPRRATTPPPHKRDLPFVLFSPSESQRRDRKSSVEYNMPIMQDGDDLVGGNQ